MHITSEGTKGPAIANARSQSEIPFPLFVRNQRGNGCEIAGRGGADELMTPRPPRSAAPRVPGEVAKPISALGQGRIAFGFDRAADAAAESAIDGDYRRATIPPWERALAARNFAPTAQKGPMCFGQRDFGSTANGRLQVALTIR